MKYFYIKNLRDSVVIEEENLSQIEAAKTGVKPSFKNKSEYRAWCSKTDTDHCFFCAVEGDNKHQRIAGENYPRFVHGIVADYDAVVDWDNINRDIAAKFGDLMPTWRTRTHSGYMRLVWEFESPIPTCDDSYGTFMHQLKEDMGLAKAFAGFDNSSLKANQYFEIGEDWVSCGKPLRKDIYQTAVMTAASTKPPRTTDIAIPPSVVHKEIEKVFPNRWSGPFEIGSRGALFWIDDGIDREGCQVVEDGLVCYSDRAGQGFMSWREIFGSKFVKKYERIKLGTLLDDYWYNGRSFFKLLRGSATSIPREQLVLELRQAGFTQRARKGKTISEVDEAILTISNTNRVDEIAPVVFSTDRVVEFQGHRILNSAAISSVSPADNGDPKHWPFLHGWLTQLFENPKDGKTTDYFFSWMQRFYLGMHEHKQYQGQALILVGPTGKGKTLLSNRVISALVGGCSDASEYLSGLSRFNKELARVPAWVVDDTTSSASFQDQLKATELIKRAVANPRIEYQAKYADSLSIPWAGRVIMSMNMDANSLSVLPALDSSNRDKIMALRIANEATGAFPPNSELEAIITQELPFFARFLIDWKIPKECIGTPRFGVASYIDESVADAAYDNSSRSSISELVDFFVRRYREHSGGGKTEWRGTLTDFIVMTQDFNNGRHVGRSNNAEFVRRGMSMMEEAASDSLHVRPIRSCGKGGGKVWAITLDPQYDINGTMADIPEPEDEVTELV